jgi:hypothetical protein
MLSANEARKALSGNLRNLCEEKENYEVGFYEPCHLLTAKRFDLIAKFLYVEYRELGIHSSFAKQLYLAHINAFNGFVENDESGKVGADAFIANFDALIDSLKVSGFDDVRPVPLGHGVIADGAHRAAACMYFGIPIRCVELDTHIPEYDYAYFFNRGLDITYLDAMAIKYCDLREDTFLVFVWPTAQGKDEELTAVLRRYGDIVYRKDVFLNGNGQVQLMTAVYEKEKWLGDERSNFVGARNKASWCFGKSGPLRVFLLQSNTNMIELKEQIRHLFQVQKHSVHINDSHAETQILSRLVFNENSIHHLNTANLVRYPWFSRLVAHYEKFLPDNIPARDDYCLDGSSVLAAYGLREVRDLDFLSARCVPSESGFVEIGCHNAECQGLYGMSQDEIIFNPRNHFFFRGMKIISMENLVKAKGKRAERKDIEDIALIEALQSGLSISKGWAQHLRHIVKPAYIRGRVKFYLLKIRFYLTLFLRTLKG